MCADRKLGRLPSARPVLLASTGDTLLNSAIISVKSLSFLHDDLILKK